jgi:hypothetical protein
MFEARRYSKLCVSSALCVLLLTAVPAVSAERSIVGTVYYRGGEPASGAAVELEDKTTLEVVSRLTDKEGRFHFSGLSQDKDYNIQATKIGYWSKPHVVSRFSSKPTETVKLYLTEKKD